MRENQSVAVVIPAYRVAQHIHGVLDRMPEWVDRVFVVDDASPDGLAPLVERRGQGRVTVLRHARNKGVGGATVTGMLAALEAGFQIVVKCDGDGQMDPADIAPLVAPILRDEADHAKGCRFHHTRALRRMPLWRFIGNVGLTFLTKLASGYWNVLDPVNGFFATRASVLGQIPLAAVSSRYFFETDLLIRLNIVEARVADIALPACYGDEPSSLSLTRTLFGFPLRLLWGLLRRIFWRYLFYDVSPVAVFFALGALLSAFGLAFGGIEWLRFASRGVPAPTGTIMLAVLPFIIGFQLLLEAVVLDIQNTPKAGRSYRIRSRAAAD
jgi:dolichol-phosphate mannosyltransferase